MRFRQTLPVAPVPAFTPVAAAAARLPGIVPEVPRSARLDVGVRSCCLVAARPFSHPAPPPRPFPPTKAPAKAPAVRYPPGHKRATRERILDAAGRVFRREGAAAGLGPVMAEAGLTKGAFGGHFATKDDLLAETLRHALATTLADALDAEGVPPGEAWLVAFQTRYLSPEHRGEVERGCPLPALVSDLGRAGGRVRAEFAALYEGVTARLAAHLPGGDTPTNRTVLGGWAAAAIGALAVARALPEEPAAETLAGARALLIDRVRATFRAAEAASPSPPSPAAPFPAT